MSAEANGLRTQVAELQDVAAAADSPQPELRRHEEPPLLRQTAHPPPPQHHSQSQLTTAGGNASAAGPGSTPSRSSQSSRMIVRRRHRSTTNRAAAAACVGTGAPPVHWVYCACSPVSSDVRSLCRGRKVSIRKVQSMCTCVCYSFKLRFEGASVRSRACRRAASAAAG